MEEQQKHINQTKEKARPLAASLSDAPLGEEPPPDIGDPETFGELLRVQGLSSAAQPPPPIPVLRAHS